MQAQQLIKAFLLDRRSSGCSVKTLEHHEASLTLFQRWLESRQATSHEEWSPTLIREYIAHLQTRTSKHGKPLSGHSITSYANSLLAFLRWLHEEELTPTNLAAKIKKPRPPKIIKQPYADRDIRAFLDAASSLRDKAIISVLYDCGLRAAELVSLTTDDIVMDQQLLIVRCGKGRKDRIVPMSYQTTKALMKYVMKERHSSACALFVSQQGQHLTPNAIRLLVQRLAKRGGIDGATVHRFRRSFATSFLKNQGDLFTLQKLLGHAELSTTAVYLYLSEDDLKRSHEASSPIAHLLKRR